MQFFVIDLTKRRATVAVSSIIVSLIVILAMAISIVTTVFRKELFISASNGISEEKIIIIDAGHGGEDSGAVGHGGVLEKDLNLEIAFELGKQLEDKGYIVVYTRTDDRMLYLPEENIKGIRKISDLKNRLKVADRYPDSIFVSIHMNSYGASKYSGLQVYYPEGDSDSAKLADLVQSKVKSELQPDNNRKIKEGKDIYILENINNTAELIECGFLTNPEESKKLSEKEYQKQLSFSIVCGIIEYINQNAE